MKNVFRRYWKAAALTLTGLVAVLVPLAYAATLFTSNVCMPKPTPGDPSSQNTWGALLNTGFDIIDAVTSKVANISVAGSSNVVLTFNCGSLDQTDAAQFNFTGALTGNINVLWPNSRNRTFSVTNSTTGAFTLGLGVNNGSSSPAGTTVTLAQGETGLFVSDGTNVFGRLTAGGVTLNANSVVANVTNSTGLGASAVVPNCTGALTYATGSGFGCGSGGGSNPNLTWGGVPTADFAAAVNTAYCPNTTSNTINMTLPPTPVAGNEIVFLDCAGKYGINALTVVNNGNLLMGFNENMLVNTPNAGATLVYSGVTLGWRMY